MSDIPGKPLGHKAYGSIGHLGMSRMGPGDHHVNAGQERIATKKARDKFDQVIVTEKLDGSCTAVYRHPTTDAIIALGRAGWHARSSKYKMHHIFDRWVRESAERFRAALRPGERMVGEWLAQAHGTRYELRHEPWVVFDLMTAQKRSSYAELVERAGVGGFTTAHLIHVGAPIEVGLVISLLGRYGRHGALDDAEGAVWRVERNGAFDFMAKFVRPDKVDGLYLPGVNGRPEDKAVWNWRP